jgi:hypothetical protein
MLAGLRLADLQLRMLAAAPMDRQDDFARGFVDIGDNVDDQGAQQPLAREILTLRATSTTRTSTRRASV